MFFLGGNMKKIFIFVLATVILAMISCKMMKEKLALQGEENSSSINNEEAFQLNQNNKVPPSPAPIKTDEKDDKKLTDDPKFGNDKGLVSDDTPKKDPNALKPEEPVQEPKPTRTTHYETKALDDRVRERAKSDKADPNTYRMPVSYQMNNDTGTQIYRMIGMHVIVNPDGTEVFLPDEI
jgi:hypothetical protein